MFETLVSLCEPWATFYADHQPFATAVIVVHILAMFIGGGLAIATDRAILRSAAGSADATRAVIADLSTTHTVVIAALSVSFVSGVALFASDLATFSGSTVYWTKLGAIVALLVNGLRMRRSERRVVEALNGLSPHTSEMPVPFPVSNWGSVRRTAGISLTLWLLIVTLGVVLSNS